MLIISSTFSQNILFKTATLRNKKTLASVAWYNQEGSFWNRHSPNSAVPRLNGDYITQVSKKKERKVTKKVSGVQ